MTSFSREVQLRSLDMRWGQSQFTSMNDVFYVGPTTYTFGLVSSNDTTAEIEVRVRPGCILPFEPRPGMKFQLTLTPIE